MANLDAKNVKIARSGMFYEAPLGTKVPLTNTEELDPLFKAWGYLGPDAIGEAISESVEDMPAWQNGDIVASIATESSATYTVPAMETLPHIIETVYGTVVDRTTGRYTIKPGASRETKLFLFETIDTRGRVPKKTRKYFEGQVTEIGEVSYTSTDAVIITPTIRVFGDIEVIDDALIEVPEASE